MAQYIYIPFAKDSLNEDFLELVKDTKLICEIYPSNSEASQAVKVFYKGNNNNNPENLTGDSTIYICAHGLPIDSQQSIQKQYLSFGYSPSLFAGYPVEKHAYIVSGDESFNFEEQQNNYVDIEDIIKYLVQDLNFNKANSINFKLMFCDPVNKAGYLAMEFAQHVIQTISKQVETIQIDYFQGRLISPHKSANHLQLTGAKFRNHKFFNDLMLDPNKQFQDYLYDFKPLENCQQSIYIKNGEILDSLPTATRQLLP